MNYLVLAMKRSGHHLIMNWIAAHTKQEIYNNVCNGWKDKKLLTMVGQKEFKNGIANIEDFNFTSWGKYRLGSFPSLKSAKILLVLRDPQNWLASCYKRKESNGCYRDVYEFLDKPYINDSKLKSPSRIDLYISHYKQQRSNNMTVISFNEFVRSKAYRTELAISLGFNLIESSDNVCLNVANYGKGSSFDGLNYKKDAVLKRYKEFESDTCFQYLLKKIEAGINV